MSEVIIRTEKLSKNFVSKDRKGFRSKKKKVEALKDVDLEIAEGEIFGLLGPNGAGKTTLIKCLTTLLIPTSGKAWVNGFDILSQDNLVRASLGTMLMGERGLYWKLTGRENLDYFGALYHVPKEVRKRRIEELKELLELEEFLDRSVETYSSGQKMILAFAKALINEAPILILDEPTVTMDVPTARKLRRIVLDLNERGHTILYTTHLMAEAEELCDRVAIIDHGEIIAYGTPDALKASLVTEETITLEGIIPQEVTEQIRSIAGVKAATVTSEEDGRTSVSIITENSRRLLPKIIEKVVGNGATVDFIKPHEVTLEDVFIAKTGRALNVDTRVVPEREGGPSGR